MSNEHAHFFKGGNPGFSFLPVDVLSQKVGLSEVLLRYIIALLCGYPFALIFLLLPKGNANLNHVYFTLCGMLMSYFCFGSDCVYNLISILVSYVSLNIIGSGIYNVLFTFVFQMCYMCGAYLYYASDGYDIKWTTPQCLLCLKLIGLSWDCYDGRQKKEKLKPYQLESCYEDKPNLLQMLGFSYFFGSYLAGPLFSFKNYVKFADQTLYDDTCPTKSRFWVCFKRILAGIFASIIFAKYDSIYPCEKLLTEEFQEQSFLWKCTQMFLTYHIHFCKYVFIWMLSESICIITGLSYNGMKDGKAKWDGVRNFKYRSCLFGPWFQDMLEGFNINTSRWCGKYIFRRLAFLGNKTASHILTLLFLSLWHGFYIGYIILFAIEFGLLISERNLCSNLRRISGKTYEELSFPLRLLIRIFGIVYRGYVCAFAATAFMLLRWRRIRVVYASVHYWGVIAIGLEVILIIITNIMVKRNKPDTKKES